MLPNTVLLSFDWYDIASTGRGPRRITIYFNQEDLFFLCEASDASSMCRSSSAGRRTNQKTLTAFFVALLKGDIEHLEALEERITEAEVELSPARGRGSTRGSSSSFRRSFLRLKRYYEQLNQIFEGLTENENGLLPPEDLRYFASSTAKSTDCLPTCSTCATM